MKSFPPSLSPEEEQYYLQKYIEGDLEAKHILIEHNLRLVAHVIKKYQHLDEDPEDLISIGTIGLIKAIITFNPDKNNRLGTYAARCIENEILMLIRANKKHKKTVSLFESVGVDKDGNELTLMDLLFEKEECVFEEVEKGVQREKLVNEVRRLLSDREYMVICLRYALKGGVPLPQREVANVLKISRSYISRIEKRAVEKLRANLKMEDFF